MIVYRQQLVKPEEKTNKPEPPAKEEVQKQPEEKKPEENTNKENSNGNSNVDARKEEIMRRRRKFEQERNDAMNRQNNKEENSQPTEKQPVSNSPNDFYSRIYSTKLETPLYKNPFPDVRADNEKAQEVKEAFLHSWNNYKKFCWGHDSIRPVTHHCQDFLNGGLTIIDSISTLVAMNLSEEIADIRKYVKNEFRLDGGWSLFEFSIRFLGGMISAYQMTGAQEFYNAAVNLGEAMYSVVERNGGFYSSGVSFHTENGRLHISGGGGGHNLAEVGTYQLEFAALTEMTGNPKFLEVALRVYHHYWGNGRGAGMITDHIGGGADSYYEYIIKLYHMTNGCSKKLLDRYLLIARDLKNRFFFTTIHKKLLGIGVSSGSRVHPMQEHLATFAGGMFAYGAVADNPEAERDLNISCRLAKSYAEVYKGFKSGVMAEQVQYNTDDQNDPSDFRVAVDKYILRPESVESVYYAWKWTGEQAFRDYAYDMFKGIEKSTRTTYGHSEITGIDSDRPHHLDVQESFFLAETLKYLYLTFADSRVVSPVDWVFNTEAHPLKRWSPETTEKFKSILKFDQISYQILKD